MPNLQITTSQGGSAVLNEADIEAFQTSLRGDLLTPDHESYDEVRVIWNGMHDKRPALIETSKLVASTTPRPPLSLSLHKGRAL